MDAAPQNVIIDGKLNPALIDVLKKNAFPLDGTSQYAHAVKLINQAVRIFGQEITYVVSERLYGYTFSLRIFQGGVAENSIYFDARKGALFSIHGGKWYAEKINELSVLLLFASAIGQEVVTLMYKNHNHNATKHVTLSKAIGAFDSYLNRIARYTKKHSLTKREATVFSNALELYSGYATRHKAQLNVASYLARAVKAGMNAEKAVWMVYNGYSIDLAADYKDIPTTWVLRI